MKELGDVSIDEVRTLVAERQRYDDWLSALEAKRTETSGRVFDRVRADYSARRAAVIGALAGHVDALAALGGGLEARLGELDAQLATHEDERAEAMLRTAVGEYDGDRWEIVRQQVEANILELGERRAALLAEVDDVQSLLSSARREPAPIASESPAGAVLVPAVPEPLSTDLSAPATAAATVEHPSHDAAPADAGNNAGPGELFAVAGAAEWPSAGETHDELPPVPFTATQEEIDGTDFDDALALFSPGPRTSDGYPTPLHGRTVDLLDGFEPADRADDVTSPRVAVSSASEPERDPSKSSVAQESLTAPSSDPFDDLAFLRSVIDPATQNNAARTPSSGDQQKTLRCTECGTMNLPTEWYCERCGGELAAF